jgi:hypothetical protein
LWLRVVVLAVLKVAVVVVQEGLELVLAFLSRLVLTTP